VFLHAAGGQQRPTSRLVPHPPRRLRLRVRNQTLLTRSTTVSVCYTRFIYRRFAYFTNTPHSTTISVCSTRFISRQFTLQTLLTRSLSQSDLLDLFLFYFLILQALLTHRHRLGRSAIQRHRRPRVRCALSLHL